MASDDEEFLKERREALAESVRFFSAQRKPEREVWVADHFLENLNIAYSTEEVVSSDDDPPDVIFRDARFEIKEIMDPGRRRHAEYRAASERADSATKPSDFLTPFTPRDTTIQAVYDLVLAASAEHHARYAPAVCRSLDLLFYVNLQNVMGLTEQPFPDVSALRAHPWRSVSFLMGARSCVLTAAEDAPIFIRQAGGGIVHRAGPGRD